MLSSGFEGKQLYLDLTKGAKLTALARKDSVLIETPKKAEPASKKAKDENAGPGWFNMQAGELTSEVKRDLKLIEMRGALDPKRFYKKTEKISKYFQVGTIMDNSADYFSGRLKRKERKETVLETLLDDTEKKKYLKKKFLELQKKKQAGGKKDFNKRKSRYAV